MNCSFCLRTCYAMSGTDRAHAVLLPPSISVPISGPHIAQAAMLSQHLNWQSKWVLMRIST
eukprot:3523312-Rhodomonas_salina.1